MVSFHPHLFLSMARNPKMKEEDGIGTPTRVCNLGKIRLAIHGFHSHFPTICLFVYIINSTHLAISFNQLQIFEKVSDFEAVG